jgi:hypothetical protein
MRRIREVLRPASGGELNRPQVANSPARAQSSDHAMTSGEKLSAQPDRVLRRARSRPDRFAPPAAVA